MTFRIIKVLLISMLLCSGISLDGQDRLRCDEGSVSFTSDAPLELIQASSSRLKGILDLQSRNFAFTVDVNSFDGFNSPLQKTHFRENYLESHSYPAITFTGKIIEANSFQGAKQETIRAKGVLTIHGVAQERIIKCEVSNSKKSIEVNSRFSVSLSEHDIRIPKIVNQKIANDIQIEVRATLQPR